MQTARRPAGEAPLRSVTLLMSQPIRVKEEMREMASRAKKEILLLLPTASSFHREESIGVVDLIEEAAARGVPVTILSPVDPNILERVYMLKERHHEVGGRPVELVSIPEARAAGTVTILVIDQRESMIIEQQRPDEKTFEKAIGLAIYSTSPPTVRANVRFVERMKEVIAMAIREEALLLTETRNRRQAELLQDILTHDMRNFNQISLSSAEALRERVGPQEVPLVDNIIKAIESSSALIDDAKTLSKIVSSEHSPLDAMDLEESIRRSLSIVTKAYPERTLDTSLELTTRTKVLADSLLDEVFVNVISNSVKYTDGKNVPLEIQVGELSGPSAQDDLARRRFVRVSIIDHGRGIPDSMKDRVFTRYQETKSGSGLGLSIVRALVVDRYGGRVRVADRVSGDHKKGVLMEIWLRRAQS